MERELQRPIDELVARYTLEPTLRDIYVEGQRDKLFLEWFLNKTKCADVAVFEIKYVNVQNELLSDLGLKSGNRDRIVALALEFQHRIENEVPYLSCIADSDFDFLLGHTYRSNYLIYTDFTSMEIYCCSENILRKFFSVGICRSPCDISKLYSNMVNILRGLFLIRATNERLEWHLSWIPFVRYCTIKDNLIKFDFDTFLKKYLIANSRYQDLEEFLATYKELQDIELKTAKHCIHKDELLELLGWYVSKIYGSGGNRFRNQEVIRAILLPMIELDTIISYEMFQILLNKYST